MLFTLGSNSQALKAILITLYIPVELIVDESVEGISLGGGHLRCHGHTARGGVLNAGKTTSSENSSVEVQSKHPCTIEYSIPLRRSEFGLSDVRECHSYLQGKAFDSMVLHKNLVQSGFYTSQKV